ncbi:hypothetical protein FIBSPDRAFT_865922 [Athelia psychrophila]|uniref:F-box domain-containing protein n=1 Tax=Athelia psychrophila TaxID=1759441 RepID=A0A166F471_9AGAM|nr:hypothetical protein FIBSPDRAFT_865922 [Fibularhizoctonia sp. CBS 109695]
MPFSSLPCDILRDIFMRTRKEYDDIRDPYTKIPTVVMLSQIAPFIQRIVYNEALLWTRINDQVLANPIHLYRHLELSRHCPLDISFNLHSDFEDDLDISFLSNFMPLLAHSDRWRRLHLRSWSRRLLNATVNILKYMRPQMLEELDVTWDEDEPDPDEAEDDDEDIRPFFQCGAPCLKKLSLTGVRCIPSITCDLTDLQLGSNAQLPLCSYSEFVEIISKMVSLTNISMDGPVVRVRRRDMKNPKIVAFPNLHSLVLSMFGEKVEICRYLAAMLALFSSAPLKLVDFNHQYWSDGVVHPRIIAMSSGRIRFPQVIGLVLELEGWIEDDVRRFIQALPSVERLYFRWWHRHAKGILDALVNTPNVEDLFPLLHAIYLGHIGDPGPGSILHKVRQLAESRIASGKPLRELWIRQESGTRPACDDVDWIQEHVQVQWVAPGDWDRVFDLAWKGHSLS